MNKLDPKISFKGCFVDLDEIADNIDIDIRPEEGKVPEATKTASAKPFGAPKGTVPLF